jgi:hypothetical protein
MKQNDPFEELARRLMDEDNEFTTRTYKIIKKEGSIPQLAIIILTLVLGFAIMFFSLISKVLWLGVLSFAMMVFIISYKLSKIKIDNRSIEDFLKNN